MKKRYFLLSLTLAAALLAGCGNGGAASGSAAASGVSETLPSSGMSIEAPELDAPVRSGTVEKEDGAVALALSDESGSVTITEAGTYVLSGTLTDGQITVKAPSDAKVKLILNGADITGRGCAAIYAVSADKVILSTAAGSVNRLSSTGDFIQTDDNTVDAAVFAKCDLNLNGSGTLNITCDSGHGAVSKDDLKLKDGTVNIRAAKKALEGKESLRVEGGALYAQAGTKGLFCGGDEEKAGDITIDGGSVTVAARDDAVHAHGTVTVSGGILILAAGDDGIHADAVLDVSGGSITVTESYEGLEANDIVISGGSIAILASDDGINAAGKSGSSDNTVRRGGDPFANDSGSTLTVSGGVLVVNAEGDGLDCNGDLLVTGGEIYVSGPTRGGNGALDYGTSGVITGGVVIAAGSADMAENFGAGSTQGSILLNVGNQPAGSTVTVTDESGTVLASYTPEKSYQSVVVSAPGLIQGGSYTVTAGSFSETVTLENLIYGSGMGMGGPGGPGGMPGGPGGGPGGPGGNPGGGPGGGPGGPGGGPGGRL